MFIDGYDNTGPSLNHPVLHQICLIRRNLDAHIRGLDFKAPGVDHIGCHKAGAGAVLHLRIPLFKLLQLLRGGAVGL